MATSRLSGTAITSPSRRRETRSTRSSLTFSRWQTRSCGSSTPAGNQIGHSDDDGEDKASHISFTPTEAGTYYLRVTAFNDDLTGRYSISVLRVNRPVARPGTLSVSPTEGTTSTGVQGGPFNPSSMVFSLSKTSQGDDEISWTVTSDRNWITVPGGEGRLAGWDIDRARISINENANILSPRTHTAVITFTNMTNGLGNTTRVVQLIVSPTSNRNRESPFADTTPIEPGRWHSADIGEKQGKDHFSFTVQQGFIYRIRTDLRGLQDTEMWLYNSDGEQIGHNDDYKGARSAGIDFTAAISGRFYARVAARYLDDTGTYGIRLWEEEPPPPPGELRFSSSEGFSATGRMGGPFKSSSKTYELSKRPSGTEDIRWTVTSDEDWVSISIASGVLIDHDTDYVILSINEGAKSLEAGVHTAAVSFTNTTNGFGNATVKIELTVRGAAGGRPGVLVITPDANLATSGPEGGPFSTTSKVYSITSSTVDGDSFVWSASSDQDWLSMSPSGGEIPGQVPHVTVTLNARALLLPAGLHTALVSFTNQTTGLGDTTRIVELTVDASGTGGFTAVSAGRNHTCAIDAERYPVCWGDDEWGQASPPDGERLTSISAADNHTCGLREDGTPVCWGSNTYGQSGPPTGESLTQISSRYNHTCGLRTDGTVTCWGLNEQGQASPPPGEVFRSIASGVYQTCGHRLDGTVACWGDDSYGQSGLPRTERFEAVGTGWKVSCGLRPEGTVACVGSDPEADFTHPAEARVSTLSVGWLHACGLQLDGTPVCWGLDWHGRTSPPVVEKFVQISAGDEHTCGLRSDGVVLCWGDNTFGESSPPNSVETEPGDDHGDSTDAATAIAVNRPYTGDIEESNDIDFFAFHGESEVRYTIETELGSNPDTVIDLYDSTGSRISGNDDGGVGRASKLESSFHVSGTYFVSVRGYSSSSRGTYQIIVSGDIGEVVDPPSADRVLFSGPASKIAHEGFETTDTLVSVTLSPPDGEGLRELSISIEDADGISGAGSVTVVVPRESWIDYEGVSKWTRDTSGAEWRLYPPGFERSAVGADETFNALARQIPLVGNLMSFTDFLSYIWFNSVETVESPNDPVFHADYQNCYSQITVPWFVSNVSTVSAIDTVLGVRISIPVVVSDDDYAAFVSSFPGREPAPQGGVTMENAYVEMGDLLSTNRPAAACNAR